MFDQDQASSRNWSPFTISVGGNFFCVRLDKKDLHKIYLTKKQLWDYPKWSHSVNIKSWGLVRHCSQVWWWSAGTMWVNTMNGPANGPISMGLNAWFWQPGGGGTGTWYWYILARVPRSPTVAAGHNRAGLRLVVVTLGLNGAGAGHLYTSTPGGHQLSSLLITPASAWDSGSCMSSSDSVVSRLPVIDCDWLRHSFPHGCSCYCSCCSMQRRMKSK